MKIKESATMIINPLVTVVIPCFNSEMFIQDCVRSVLQQTYKNIEIILIDDGSTDGTLLRLEEFKTEITILRKENEGAASARNLGIKNSNGIYIAFLDSDDVWHSEKIEKQLRLMTEKNLDLVYSGGESFGHPGVSITYTPVFSGDCYKKFLEFPTRAIIILGCSSAMIRKSILDFSGNFDVKFTGAAEDWDFFRRFCKYGKVDYLNANLVKYRLHDGNVSTRGIRDFYSGNLKAIKKMINEDKSIRTAEKIRIIIKFEVIILKFCLKKYGADKIKLISNEIAGHFGRT